MAIKNPEEPFVRITVEEAREMLSRDDVAIVDVREPWEYQQGHIPGAKLLPVGSVFSRKDELPKDKEIIFTCAVGQRSALACEIAASFGFTRIYNLEGGTEAWAKAGLPLEK